MVVVFRTTRTFVDVAGWDAVNHEVLIDVDYQNASRVENHAPFFPGPISAQAVHHLVQQAVLWRVQGAGLDGRIDFTKLSATAQIQRHEASAPSEVAARVQGHDVVINKEMPITAELIRQFPPSVKLICEAGTGYNNIDLPACRDKGILVCNVPTYATEAMAHMAITLVMALSCSLVPQTRALCTGNRA